MGIKFIKYVGYAVLFCICFLFFLYLTFPYEVLKDRITDTIELELGQGLEVQIKELEPYWFTGIDASQVTIVDPMGSGGDSVLLECKRLRARASFFSLLFGRPRISFLMQAGKGEIEGKLSQSEEMLEIDARLSDFDVSHFQLIAVRTGLKFSSIVDGNISLRIDKPRPVRSTGKINLTLSDLQIKAGEAKLGEMALPLPDLTLAEGKESKIKLDIDKGAINFEIFKFAGGDLTLDLKGKMFISSTVKNYRFNLSGTFGASKKLGEALPFLFIVEQQKRPDGNYPLTLTGRLGKPFIKVGTFTVPM